jgi:diguanylate cyclase (GGDEF)-like protein
MVYYHPTLPYGTMLFEDNDEESEVDEAIREGTSGEEAIVYNYRGVDKRLVVRTLENGMRLTVSIDAAEVYADRNMLIRRLAIASILIIVLSAVLSLFVIRRSLKPLNDLAASARKVADGDLDVQILSSDTAELSDLISSYQRTVAHLKEQMAFINELARHDGLTGLLNKSSEERALRLLDRDIEGGTARFSLAVFDVNNLKDMNDTYGHESGDLYLKSAANAIREAFKGYSTFRIGGDEFAAFVQVTSDSDEKAEDVMNRCVARLDEIMESTNEKAEQAWERVELACGTAAFDPNTDTSASQVLARADEHMYANKRQMKRENHSEH